MKKAHVAEQTLEDKRKSDRRLKVDTEFAGSERRAAERRRTDI